MIFSNIFAIALGSNSVMDSGADLTLTRGVIERAIKALAALANTELIAQANHYQSKAYPAGSGADYINTAVLLRGDIAPPKLLAELHKIEESFGRTRNARWQSRILDLDILFYGDKILPNPQVFRHWQNLPLKQQMREAPNELILPHPRLQNRAFVLAPLADIAPDWHHPVIGKTTKELLESLPKSDLEQTWRV